MTTPTKPLLLRVHAALGLLAVSTAVAHGAEKAWLCDDAFVTLRYARNLVEGKGLVFNDGERVEGITNMAWTLILAAFERLGVAGEDAAIFGGLISHAAITIALVAWSRTELIRRGPQAGWLDAMPVAALCWAAMRDAAIWATSGLETAPYTAAVTWSMLRLTLPSARRGIGPLITGMLLALASGLRPDGALFFAIAAVWMVLFGGEGLPDLRRSSKRTVLLAAGFLPPWLALLLFRWSYYGSLVPNTAFAKSAHLAWWEQGWHYLAMFFSTYDPLLIGVVGLFAGILLALRPTPAAPSLAGRIASAATLAPWMASVAVYTTYVARVGGDFMFARVLIPVVPAILIGIEAAAHLVPKKLRFSVAPVIPAVWIAIYGAQPPCNRFYWPHGIADEWRYYDTATVANAQHRAQGLRRYLGGLDVRYAILGGELREVYWADLPVVIEATTGLTDATIARQPTPNPRGRIGHEKVASPHYLIGQRNVQISCHGDIFRTLQLQGRIPRIIVWLGDLRCTLLYWDPKLVDELRARGALVPDVLTLLDDEIGALESMSDQAVGQSYDEWSRFYFAFVEDPGREATYRRRLNLPVHPSNHDRATWAN